MADNRMWLRCRTCGARVLLGKELGDWHLPIRASSIDPTAETGAFDVDAFDAFLARHGTGLDCDGEFLRAGEVPFMLEYESMDVAAIESQMRPVELRAPGVRS
jgi:hypothetical protein